MAASSCNLCRHYYLPTDDVLFLARLPVYVPYKYSASFQQKIVTTKENDVNHPVDGSGVSGWMAWAWFALLTYVTVQTEYVLYTPYWVLRGRMGQTIGSHREKSTIDTIIDHDIIFFGLKKKQCLVCIIIKILEP
jgi:hypothetical protein